MAKSVRIPVSVRRFLYAALTVSWCSGIVFFILNQWVTLEGEFGPEKHPWQIGFLRIHGAGAFLMMITFGYLLASHIAVSWPLKKMRPLGVTLVAAIGFLIVSAYGLYYLGDPDLRTYLAYAHAGVGVSLPFLLMVHLVQGRRQRNLRKTTSARKAKAKAAA